MYYLVMNNEGIKRSRVEKAEVSEEVRDFREYLSSLLDEKYRRRMERDLERLEILHTEDILNKNKEWAEYYEKYRRDESEMRKRIYERVKNKKVLERFIRIYTGREIELKNYGRADDVYEFELRSDFLDPLPRGYYYKGGSARAVLERFLGLDPDVYPRDIDLAVDPKYRDSDLDDRLARKYMPEDYANGYGVELLEDDYFESRDFTINEVLYDGQKITASRSCLLDTIRSVVRITDFEKGERYYDEGDYYVNPKLLAKALRFLAQRHFGRYDFSFADEKAVE